MRRTSARISLIWLLFTGFAVLTILIVTVIGGLVLARDYRRFHREADRLREDYVRSQKQLIRSEVDKVVDFIEYNWSRAEQRLKHAIRDRTYEAHAIATHLYDQHKGTKSDAEIREIILDALRPIRFNHGRGYYFATGLDGVEILFADRPELEGKLLLDMQDTRGAYVIRDMIELVKRHGEGFYQYTWTKPKEAGGDFRKIAYIKYFAPFNGFIGTGEYLDDVERDIQQEVLERIRKIRFGEDGYIFVVSYDGVTLMNGVQPELIGENLWDMSDPYGVKVIQEERRAAELPDGDFISYHWRQPSTGQVRPKISFVQGFAQWRWMVGAGVYSDGIEAVIAALKTEMERDLWKGSLNLGFILISILAGVLFLCYELSRYFNHQFDLFISFFRGMETGGSPIAAEQMLVREFELLGRSANRMLEKRRQVEAQQRLDAQRLQALFELNQMRDAQLQELTGFAMEQAVRLTGSTIGYVAFSNEDESVLTMHAWSEAALEGCDIADKPLLYPVRDTGLWGEAVRQRRPIITNDYTAPNPWKKGTPAGHLEIVRHMNVPIFDAGRIVVVAGVGNKATDYDETDIRQLTLLMEGMWRIVHRRRVEEERALLQEQLNQVRKLESVGRLAGGVAHDFNNMLSPILGYAEMLRDELPDYHPHRVRLEQIIQAAGRARDLVRQLLAFARKQTLDLKPLDLNTVITGFEKMLRRTIREDVLIETRLAPSLGAIEGDAGQIEQIILNLAVNAQDAMPQGGMMIIETSEVFLDEAYAEAHPEVRVGPYVMLAVSDTGCGMDQQTLNRIFDPFFTTKELGRGTGLGLATVYGIVKQHGASIWAYSEEGKGTTIRIYFPRSEQSPHAEPPTPPKGAVSGTETVLVVEDLDQVRAVACEMLKRLGYRVIEAAGGRAALQVAAACRDPIQLLLTDVVMAEMNGRQLYQLLSEARPGIRVLYMSGYTSNVIGVHGVLEPGVDFIQKPFSMHLLAAKVRAALDRQPGSG